tara:strand:- start:1384 stop:1569 length:186 start_codon:yes stop_codon:yes gene_type:complete
MPRNVDSFWEAGPIVAMIFVRRAMPSKVPSHAKKTRRISSVHLIVTKEEVAIALLNLLSSL